MYIVKKLTIFLFSLFCVTLAHASAGEPYNYYVPAPDRLLENVEKYHLQQGIDKIKKGQFEYAWSEFAFMLHYFPNHPIALQHISSLAMQVEKNSRAQKYFDRAIKLYPQESATYALYGIFMHKIENYHEAVALYQQAISIDNSPAEYHYNLGLSYLALQQYDQAYQSAQKAYNLGYPLPGLKNQLVAEGAWKSKA
tara:strand:+ start:10939 stop:11526 length:588 start_codon:yes stop_codon:yes gene_type:complete